MSVNIAILISGKHGRGSNMAAIAQACRTGQIDGNIKIVIGNYEQSPALERARSLGLKAETLSTPKPLADETALDEYSRQMLKVLQTNNVDLICLAGYLLKVPDLVLHTFPGRITNIHNALLPSFGGKGMYGKHVHQAVIDYGVKFSGCTVHFVEESYDTGPIIVQRAVPVYDGDTVDDLAARVLVAEHEAYPAAIELISKGKVELVGRKVRILSH